MPPWYYGFAYENFSCEKSCFMPIPFNYLYRCRMWFWRCWDRFRSKPDNLTGWILRRINSTRGIAYERGYTAGLRRGIYLQKLAGE